MIKLICCDLDGTLLTKEKKLTNENKLAIKKFREKGGHFVIATGRPIEGVLDLIKELDLTAYNDATLTYNGAVVRLNKTKEFLNKITISGKIVKDLYKESLRLGTYFHFFSETGELYTPEENEYTQVEERINKIEAKVVDPLTFVKDDDRFIKAMMVGDNEVLNYARNNLDKRFLGLSIVRSSLIFLEFQDYNVSKGNGLKFLQKYYNLNDDETMAFGDEENDLSMIKEAYIGVAMENGVELCKKAAKFITKDNEHSGVAFGIEKFAL